MAILAISASAFATLRAASAARRRSSRLRRLVLEVVDRTVDATSSDDDDVPPTPTKAMAPDDDDAVFIVDDVDESILLRKRRRRGERGGRQSCTSRPRRKLRSRSGKILVQKKGRSSDQIVQLKVEFELHCPKTSREIRKISAATARKGRKAIDPKFIKKKAVKRRRKPSWKKTASQVDSTRRRCCDPPGAAGNVLDERSSGQIEKFEFRKISKKGRSSGQNVEAEKNREELSAARGL